MRRGFGWEPPKDWRGRAVLVSFQAVAGAAVIGLVVPAPHAVKVAAVFAILIAIASLIAVMMVKGEPPGRRQD